MTELYVVVWDCLNPRPVACFHDRSRAEAFAKEFKIAIDAFFKKMGMAGEERVYVSESPLDPPSLDELPTRHLNIVTET